MVSVQQFSAHPALATPELCLRLMITQVAMPLASQLASATQGTLEPVH